MLRRLLALACTSVELAEADVAVDDEGAYAELLSGCERVTVAAVSVLRVSRWAVTSPTSRSADAS